MTDFLEMAMADIDDVFFQEFVEQHTCSKDWKADGVRPNQLHDKKLSK